MNKPIFVLVNFIISNLNRDKFIISYAHQKFSFFLISMLKTAGVFFNMSASFLSFLYQMGLERCTIPVEMFTREYGKMDNVMGRCFETMLSFLLILSFSPVLVAFCHRHPSITQMVMSLRDSLFQAILRAMVNFSVSMEWNMLENGSIHM